MTNWEKASKLVDSCVNKDNNRKCEDKCNECIVVDRMEIISYIEIALKNAAKLKSTKKKKRVKS
jgi:hypothetical protein